MKLVLVVLVGLAGCAPVIPPPHGAWHIAIDYRRIPSGDKRHFELSWTGQAYVSGKTTIAPALVDALYLAFAATRESAEPLRCFGAYDDYGRFTIAIGGDEPIEARSSSRCRAYAPWNITRAGKLYVQFDGNVWRGIEPIVKLLDAHWPETPMWQGIIEAGRYPGAPHQPSGDAEACAHRLESKLGIVVADLYLSCEPGSDCTTEHGQARTADDRKYPLTCTNGVATLSEQRE